MDHLLRTTHLQNIQALLTQFPIVALIGPRQCGKTTLTKVVAQEEHRKAVWFDLEDPTDLSLFEHPKLTLESLSGLIVIDEVQQRPDLFPLLRVLVDRSNQPGQFLLLGSASGALLRQTSESLAGAALPITNYPL